MWFNSIILILCLAHIQPTSQQDPKSEHLLVANTTQIYKFDEINYSSTLITHLPIDNTVKVLDYSYNDRLVFWLNQLDKSINVHSIDTGRKIDLFRNSQSSPEYFAVDWITKKIYWIDSEPYRIEVADFNGANNSLILLVANQIPKCIGLAPLSGLLFWNDNQNGTINRISMNGDESTIRQIVFNTKLSTFTIDQNSKKIYWNDILKNRIRSADFNGLHQRDIQSTYTPSIAFYNGNIYYSDLVNKTIYSINVIGRKQRKLIYSDDSSQLNYFSHKNQPDYASAQCLVNNGGCSNLCLLSSEQPHFSCACSAGVPLAFDNRTCKTSPDQYLLVAFANEVDYISLDSKGFLPKHTQIKNQALISGVDFDSVEQRIYWIDRNKVKSAHSNGSDERVIVECELEYERLAIDTLNRNIYLVKNSPSISKEKAKKQLSYSSNFSIEVVSIAGTFKKSLIEDHIDSPRGIAVDNANQFFYWSDWGKKPKIERVSFDLKVRSQIIKTDIAWPNAILIDQQTKKLYWCDAKLYKIESADLDGSNRRILLKLEDQFLDLTLLGDYIYWIDRMKNQIGRVHKMSGSYEMITNRDQKLSRLMGLSGVLNRAVSQQVGQRKACSQLSLSADLCACSNGFVLQKDETTCLLGNDACAINNGNCDQHCDQLIGNHYKCSCYDGFALDANQRKCHIKNDVLSKQSCEQMPCSHKCVLVQDEIHCSCPSEMYLSIDGKTCLYQIAPSYELDNQQSTTNQTDDSSTLAILIISLLIVCAIVISVLVVRYVVAARKESKLKNSKEQIVKNSDHRRIDFGYSLSNVESSIICDRSLGVGASALDEDRSLMDTASSLDNMSSVSNQYNRLPKFDRNNMRFDNYHLTRLEDLNEFDTSIDQMDDLSNVDLRTNLDTSRIFVPPPTPLNNFEDDDQQSNYNDKRIYNDSRLLNSKGLHMKDELAPSDFLNNSSSILNTSISTYHQTLNPPNSLSSSINNLYRENK